mmetsp:Transcript_68374/g.198173  ORF Transcript_68374/g.198173 Transcript_68374/m.198173 type:complete len:335 (+) Transcript_68374:110-1114(+)
MPLPSSVVGDAAKPRRLSMFSMPRFEFCLTPREHLAAVRSPSAALSLCGAPLCSGMAQDVELNIVRVPRCDIPRCDVPRCGHCALVDPIDLADATELSLSHETRALGSPALQRNLHMAKVVARELFAEMEARCTEERTHYDEAGIVAPRQKVNTWTVYTSKAKQQRFIADALEFVQHNAECRTKQLTAAQLRFLLLLQHLISEDTSDFFRLLRGCAYRRCELAARQGRSQIGVLRRGALLQLARLAAGRRRQAPRGASRGDREVPDRVYHRVGVVLACVRESQRLVAFGHAAAHAVRHNTDVPGRPRELGPGLAGDKILRREPWSRAANGLQPL